jgi:hypothetical protein
MATFKIMTSTRATLSHGIPLAATMFTKVTAYLGSMRSYLPERTATAKAENRIGVTSAENRIGVVPAEAVPP